MYLQQMRFGTRITYELICDVKRDAVLVPPFIFQPLAENAIIHGLSPKESGGRILVHIRKEMENLFITVRDTGVGMEEEELSALLNSLTGEEMQTRGIGLKNVYERIKKLYRDSEFEISSNVGEGTTIQIRLDLSET